jgi:succinate dehydrogenase hydrophobic membrane anchor protein
MSLLKQFGTGSGGSQAWIWQRISGLILVIALFLHYMFLHFLNDGLVTYQGVSNRLITPLWKTIDLTFLAAALFHAAIGVIINIHDYIHRPGLRMFFVGLTWVVAIILLITGIATVVTFQPA